MFEPDDLLLALSEAQVQFIVIGGVAVGVHGFVRATVDLDIVPDPDSQNLARLARLLEEIEATQVGIGEFSPEEFPHDPTDPAHLAEGANFRLETNHGPLDIMQWVPGINSDAAYPELTRQAIEVAFQSTKIRVCGIEHLRTMKRTAARERDLMDLRELGE